MARKGNGQTDEQCDEAGHDRAGSKRARAVLRGSSEHHGDDGAPEGGEGAQRNGTGEKRCGPGLVRTSLPEPLPTKPDSGNTDGAGRGEPQCPAWGDHKAHDLDDNGSPEIERRARIGVLASLHEREQWSQDEVDGHDQQGAPATKNQAGRYQRDTGGQGDDHGVVELLELGHAEVELGRQTTHAPEDEHGSEHVQQPRAPAGARKRARLAQHEPTRDWAQGGAADHQQVGRAPHGDVDAVGLVPQGIEREPRHTGRPQYPKWNQGARHDEAPDA